MDRDNTRLMGVAGDVQERVELLQAQHDFYRRRCQELVGGRPTNGSRPLMITSVNGGPPSPPSSEQQV